MLTVLDNTDVAVRAAAFAFLAEQTRLVGEVLPIEVLRRGFDFRGDRVPLMGPQGIFKPRHIDLPISITSVPPSTRAARPYDDQLGSDGALLYRYRGTDPTHRDNVGLRTLMQKRVPLVYLHGVVPGRYLPIWPVFIIADNPGGLAFSVVVDDAATIKSVGQFIEADAAARRRYITVLTIQRLHQQSFREQVLSAYQQRCAVCRLQHSELLEAAHILPDGHPHGDPIVPNGLSLCKLHHAAFDRNFLGVRPDCVIELRNDLLREHDGPMLEHGIQAFHGAHIRIPRVPELQPDRHRLEARYDLFRKSA